MFYFYKYLYLHSFYICIERSKEYTQGINSGYDWVVGLEVVFIFSFHKSAFSQALKIIKYTFNYKRKKRSD